MRGMYSFYEKRHSKLLLLIEAIIVVECDCAK